MNIAFPNFGPAAMALPKVLEELGIQYTMPTNKDEEALRMGKAVSPEEICIPFKYMAGNLIQSYMQGADTVIMAASSGPCRLGEYCEILRISLKNQGYDFKWIVIDSFHSLMKNLREIDGSMFSVFFSLGRGIKLVILLDRLTRKINASAAYLKEPGQALNIVKEAESRIFHSTSFADSFGIVKETKKKLRYLEKNKESNPIRVLLVGEIYTSMEGAANGHIEERLISMGCSIKRHMDMTWWLWHTLGCAVIPRPVANIGKKHKMCDIGGYGKATVEKVWGSRKNHGIIKIMPSGCMPEIVSKSCCEMFQKKKGCRILHLIYDEMEGTTGYETRIEAFVDMLERRRNVLAGNRHRLNKHGFCNNRQ